MLNQMGTDAGSIPQPPQLRASAWIGRQIICYWPSFWLPHGAQEWLSRLGLSGFGWNGLGGCLHGTGPDPNCEFTGVAAYRLWPRCET